MPTTPPSSKMNNLQEQGRALYKRGEYAKAIESFDRAIGRAPSVQLLDNRAACHEKLNDFPAALKDAKKAIQLHREDATGYLRAGRVLTKMEKHSVALEVYSHGLRCIKHVGLGYEALKKAHKATLDIVSPPKSVDPLTMLPRELAETIMQYLSFKQRINACLVSRGWNNFIRSAPNLWSHLDLSGARKNVRTAFISVAINTGRSKLREATLNRLYDVDKTIRALVGSCPLEKLTLLDGGRQGSEFRAALKKAKDLKSITIGTSADVTGLDLLVEQLANQLETLQLLPYLNDFPMVRYEKLTSLSVHLRRCTDGLHLLANTHQFMPNIQLLSIQGNTGWRNPTLLFDIDLANCKYLETLDSDVATEARDTMTFPESLKVLRLGSLHTSGPPDPGISVINNTFERSLSVRLPHLEELSIVSRGLGRHGADIGQLLHGFEGGHSLQPHEWKTWTKLRRLSIAAATVEGGNLSGLLREPRLQDIRELSLPDAQFLKDDTAAEIMKLCPNLSSLDLSGSDVTGVGVKAIALGQCMKEINLSHCRNVSFDAVEWARGRGLRVRFSNGDKSTGGSKVRY